MPKTPTRCLAAEQTIALLTEADQPGVAHANDKTNSLVLSPKDRRKRSRESKTHPSPPTSPLIHNAPTSGSSHVGNGFGGGFDGGFDGGFALPAPDPTRAKKKLKTRRWKVVLISANHCHTLIPNQASQRATFDTIEAYGLFNDGVRRIEPQLAPRSRMSDFHASDYLDAVGHDGFVDHTKGNRAVEKGTRTEHRGTRMRLNTDEDFDDENDDDENENDDDENDNNTNGLTRNNCFRGLWKYCQLVAGATLVATTELLTGKATLAINYMGGNSLAFPNAAHGNAYINDTALAIFQLRRRFQRIAVIDLSATHSDALQNAFYYSDNVFTVSVHRYEKHSDLYGTGRRKDKGAGNGRHRNLNVNMSPHASNANLLVVVKELCKGLVNVYKPDCVVLSVGTNGLKGGRAKLKYTPVGLSKCVDWILKVLDVPTLLLGGNDEWRGDKDCGKHARLWTLLVDTAVNATKGVVSTLLNDIPDEENPSWSLMGPSFELREEELEEELEEEESSSGNSSNSSSYGGGGGSKNANTGQMNIKINGIQQRFQKLERQQLAVLKGSNGDESDESGESSESGESGDEKSGTSSNTFLGARFNSNKCE